MDKKRDLKPYHGFVGLVAVMIMLMFAGPFLNSIFGKWYSIIGEILIPLIGFVIILIAGADIKETVPFNLPPINKFFASIGLYIGTIMLSGAFNVVISKFIPNYAERNNAITQTILTMSPIAAIISIALVPAICEELFFRGFFLATLKNVKNEALVIVIGGIAFGLAHLDLYAFISTALAGALFTFIALRTGSLLISVLIHFINNAISVVVAYSTVNSSETTERVLSASQNQTIGQVMFYLGCALLFLFFSGGWFVGKKESGNKKLIVVIISLILMFVGNKLILLDS